MKYLLNVCQNNPYNSIPLSPDNTGTGAITCKMERYLTASIRSYPKLKDLIYLNLSPLCECPFLSNSYYPVLSKEHSSILSTECPRTLYQPFGQMSNEFRKRTCAYTKSLCNGLGEETCKEGSSREDRSCRCRHTDGYVSIESLQTLTNKSCYRPKYETNGCSYFTCPEDEELNPYGMRVLKNVHLVIIEESMNQAVLFDMLKKY
uniref:Uncharacterized protein n=1 Tax=Magallana gigas TaxID=29159 RepID=K1PKX0_MAGGI